MVHLLKNDYLGMLCTRWIAKFPASGNEWFPFPQSFPFPKCSQWQKEGAPSFSLTENSTLLLSDYGFRSRIAHISTALLNDSTASC
jgi:hypothetical protein